MTSVRRRLAGLLVVPLAVLLAAGTLYDVFSVLRPARDEWISSRLMSRALLVDLIQLVAALAAIGIGIRFALRPLERLETQIGLRSPADLSALDLTAVPQELQGVVRRLNTLMQAVELSVRSEKEFLENAAHQLRTPLAGMLAQLDVLAADAATPELRSRLQAVRATAERLSRTTTQLLTLSRVDQRAYLISEVRNIDLAQLASERTAEFLPRARQGAVDLGADLQPASVTGVAWLIGEALSNLIDNALVHAPAGGTVTVRTGVTHRSPYLEVVDDGPGIRPAERERVVQRFQRGERAAHGGSGLGLAIVADVARRHGASLDIGEGEEGRGTRVRLEFPPTTGSSG